MFWGLIIQANKRYSQTISKSFHLSQAALDTQTESGNDVQVFLDSEGQSYLLCTLNKSTVKQVPLDLFFSEGDEISFSSVGGTVHLTGYLQEELDDLMDEDISSDEESAVPVKTSKTKKDKQQQKKDISVEDSDDEDDDDLTELLNGTGDMEDSDEDDEDDDNEDDEDEDDDDEGMSDDDSDELGASDDEIEPEPKKQKKDKLAAKQNGLDASKPQTKQENKKKQKDNEQQKQQQKQQQKKTDQKQSPNQEKEKTIQGGVKIQDIRVGKGAEAKSGKRVQVYYEGRLKSNNKVFDSTKTGEGFKFLLGRGEVIRGWDIGVAGMKVGSKRRITCPPNMAYGAKGSPPVIPPNSTLVFDVELRGIN